MKGEQRVKKEAENLGKGAKGQTKKQAEEVAKKIGQKSENPLNVLGFNDALMEGLYGQAYRLYNTGKYDDAVQIFRLLVMLNPTEAKYMMGLGACFHLLKEFKHAADSYSLCGVIDPKNPIPHFHASDCYHKMGDTISAIVALETSITRAKGQKEFAKLKDRAELSLGGLKKEYDKKFANKK